MAKSKTGSISYEFSDWKKLCDPKYWHPAANMFPMLKNDEGFKLEDLANSIKSTGLLNPIVMVDGKVLDGRNRLEACKLSNVSPRFVNFEDLDFKGSIEEWVVGQNASRRDLTPSQKAFAALYVIKNFKPTKEQKEEFTKGGTKWDRRIFICNMMGVDRHYFSDIVAIEKWASGEVTDRWPTPSTRPRPEVLEDIKSGLHGVASTVRKIEFWIAQAKNPDLTEQQNKECPTGQLMNEYTALYPKHILASAHEDLLGWLEGEKLVRAKRYWERLEKEYTWNTEKS